MLGTESDLEVVGEAGDGEEAVAMARSLKPDLVLMELRMPRLDGAGTTARIVAEVPGTRVLVLTTYDADGDIGDDDRTGAVTVAYERGHLPTPLSSRRVPQSAGPAPHHRARSRAPWV